MEHCGPESVSHVSIEKNWKVSAFGGWPFIHQPCSNGLWNTRTRDLTLSAGTQVVAHRSIFHGLENTADFVESMILFSATSHRLESIAKGSASVD